LKLLKLQNTKNIDFYSANTELNIELSFIDQGISAGFPSPGQYFLDMSIDLNRELTQTFLHAKYLKLQKRASF